MIESSTPEAATEELTQKLQMHCIEPFEEFQSQVLDLIERIEAAIQDPTELESISNEVECVRMFCTQLRAQYGLNEQEQRKSTLLADGTLHEYERAILRLLNHDTFLQVATAVVMVGQLIPSSINDTDKILAHCTEVRDFFDNAPDLQTLTLRFRQISDEETAKKDLSTLILGEIISAILYQHQRLQQATKHDENPKQSTRHRRRLRRAIDPDAEYERMLLPLGASENDSARCELLIDLQACEELIKQQRGLIATVITGLIVNAWQAQPGKNGMIVVQGRRENGSAIITVRDSGPGIPQATQEALRNGENVASSTNGNGAGFAAAKRALAQNTQGQIEIDSNPAVGATMTITIPIPQQTNTATARPRKKTKGHKD